jgi:RND family efflux transporter MFP subunit
MRPVGGDANQGRPIIDTGLLKELRIAIQHREDAGGPPRWVWGVGAGVLLLGALGAAGWWWQAGHQPLPVRTATLAANGAHTNANAVLQATGYVTARRLATVSAQITGTLTQVLIEEGVHVQKGQVLARLDDTALRAQLAAAEANARAVQATIEQARAQLAQAEADARRQAELAASGMSTRQAADQTATAVRSAGAQLQAVQRQAEAAQAQVAQARVNFDYATVRAPFSGVVTVKAAQVGEIISPFSAGGGFTRTGVGTIVDMDSLEVGVDVNETYIGQVAAHMPCEAVLDAYPDWRIPAHVVAVIPSADKGKATVKVRVALEKMDARVVPDMGVRVSFLAAKPTEAATPQPGVLLPPEALQQQDGAASVFVVSAGSAQRRAVTLSSDVGKMKLVSQGLKAGEKVVLSPPEGLKDGAAVVDTQEGKP